VAHARRPKTSTQRSPSLRGASDVRVSQYEVEQTAKLGSASGAGELRRSPRNMGRAVSGASKGGPQRPTTYPKCTGGCSRWTAD
jgi:hypothetical protein